MKKQQCPVCGEQNNCGLEENKLKDCWCFHIGDVPQTLLDLIPQENRGKSCVCERCIRKYKK
ncbi:cysteine-rich CWC family protein [Cytobacillus sp. Sa5YUA1]|uniref:Cysteine-rich CWC family protein n=1 Tax=Cytobacillus stercorigallinarum TaxID=2762240 RepID=A0ABR8QS18_9BACI|nr:cysteine-rich CWC family protein [Cytobacillus stercorigallinarum]MBD7938288.1 cysteine-rich CWC family protein [Cytobacillus stercorigallinarum]